MTLPSLDITNGPGQRDLEQAFVARNLGAEARFTIFVAGEPLVIGLRIYNFSYVAAHAPNYSLGGCLVQVRAPDMEKLPPFNWIFVEYNAQDRKGVMKFSNAE